MALLAFVAQALHRWGCGGSWACGGGAMRLDKFESGRPQPTPTFVVMWVFKVHSMSRLTIDLTEQQHQSIKAMAALQGKSIKQYAVERLLPSEATDESAMIQLRQLLEQRLQEALRGEISTLGIKEIAEQFIHPGDPA
jgi:Antitoxin ParD